MQPSSSPFPTSGRLIAIDYGAVRTGLAICDPDWMLASPLEVMSTKEIESSGGTMLRDLADREHVVGFVVGLPLHSDGSESSTSMTCRGFAKWLAEAVGLPVRLFDERLTTADAQHRMLAGEYSRQQKKKRVDAVAATVLLESFFDACRYLNGIAGEPVTES